MITEANGTSTYTYLLIKAEDRYGLMTQQNCIFAHSDKEKVRQVSLDNIGEMVGILGMLNPDALPRLLTMTHDEIVAGLSHEGADIGTPFGDYRIALAQIEIGPTWWAASEALVP